jgi:glycosyltransferase involved in cell wall biosynthesis
MSQQNITLSVIIPVMNEVDNIAPLLERIHESVAEHHGAYEIIFIDDRSTDGTFELIKTFMADYPIRLYAKQGEQGKAQSLLEGFALARGDILCMIDADLQYPPEAIAPMVHIVSTTMAQVVISRRARNNTGFVRKLSTKVYNLVFARVLLGLEYDTQAGLKVFRRNVIEKISIDPSPWSFDMEFIVRSLQQGYTLYSYDIEFMSRQSGKGKISLIPATIELVRAALKIRATVPRKEIRAAYKKNLKLELDIDEGMKS